MTARMPAWMIVAIVGQLVLMAMFGLFTYSLTASLAQGRGVATSDIVALILPIVLVVLCGAAAWALWRAGRRFLAGMLVWAPIPLFIALLALVAI